MEYLLALLGFVLLLGSGKYLVKGSVSLARHLRISSLVIGVTVVAFGTSAPELLVSLQAALKGHPEMAVGNVVGSNISNIGLVLGITALILPIRVNRVSITIDWPVMMAVSILFFLLVRNFELGRMEGLIFIVLLTGYVVFSLWLSRRHVKSGRLEIKDPSLTIPVSLLLITGSCLGLVIGSNLLIDNAVYIARVFGISERAISITMLAIGTSTPELVTSVMAAIQKETDISVGNILGSNIFNILSVLGITAVVKPVGLTPVMVNVDIVWMLAISVLLFILWLPLKKGLLNRFDGVVLLLVYVFYIYRVIRLG
jgi:cation:H+ antiporter